MRIGGRKDGKTEEEEEQQKDGTRSQSQQLPMGSDAAMLRKLLRGKPNTRLFRALFQYLPLRDSPNDNPNVELALQAGDLVLVRGPMDEDRFYWGETLDGRSGLVPSNFVVPDDQLRAMLRLEDNDGGNSKEMLQNNEGTWPTEQMGQGRRGRSGQVHCANNDGCSAFPSTSAGPFTSSDRCHSLRRRPSSPSFTLQVPNHLAQISHDFTVLPDHQQQPPNLPDSVCPYPPVDISRVSVQEMRPQGQPRVPFPRELQVEKRLSRSVLLSWLPPDCPSTSQSVPISQYQVCVNGTIKAVVPGTFKCRALVEELDLDKFVNVSVRTVGADGNASADAACTLAIGAEAPVAPQHVRVSQVTPVSALITWYPSNSNAEHVILLNALKIGVCPPAVFQVMLKGLSPSTIYRLSVRTKHPRAVLEKRPVERCLDFKTMPKIGLPDPPSNVQVEQGPQPNTLLVTWRPVTSQPRPPSRASVHSYLIYADGRNIAQVPSSTADHVLLRLADLADDPPVFLTVRTRTREGAISADSNIVRVPRGDEKQQQERRTADDQLLSCSLPSHIFGDLTSASVAAPSAVAPASADRVIHRRCAADPCCCYASPRSFPSVFHRRPLPSDTFLPSANAVTEQHGGGGGLLLPMGIHENKYATQQRQTFAEANGGTFRREGGEERQKQQQQYFTFHPKALHKEFPRVEERPSVLEMEQSFLLRHQQRQRLRSGTPERRSFPLFQKQRTPAAVLPGAQTAPVQKRALPAQLFRLWDEFQTSGTQSEPDLRPSRMPGQTDSRWFVAIDDHQKATEPDTLCFRKHQLIKVHGDVDRNGFYWGEVRGRFGFVPASKVIEIAKDELFMAAEQRQPQQQPQPWTSRSAEAPITRRMRWGSFKSRSYEYASGDGSRYPSTSFAYTDEQPQFLLPEVPSAIIRRSRGGGGTEQVRIGVRNSSYEPQPERRTEREKDRRMSALEMDDGGRNGEKSHAQMMRRDGHTQQQMANEAPQEEEETEDEMPMPHQKRGTVPSYETRREMEEEMPMPYQKRGTVPSYETRRETEEAEAEEHEQYQHQQQQQQQIRDRERPPLQPLKGMPSQLMVAKYDYSRQYSPNVDAEQVELSFRQGDLITVYGPMDEDGFYLGELNGVRGLVPSNFLQPAAQSAEPSSSSTTIRPKGVAFSTDLMANHTGPPPVGGRKNVQQQQQQQMSSGMARQGANRTVPTGMTSKMYKVAGTAPGPPGKTLSKKSSDLSSRKSSQSAAMRGTVGAGGGGIKKKG
ncbi:hypothetical protein niasHS_006751 [Heterodera schachtii]|uniref:Uncharacterized protein n=1 Tax=Heterodera schachtii TaxID=97005 RepID=A0ABD2JI52_HETSC